MRKFWESIYSPNYITGYNPFILKNMNKAIEHMVEAINNRKKIVIYGVPNVDGLCAISSLILVLKYLNADIEYIIHDEASSSGIISEDIKNNVSFLGGQLLITLGIDLSSEREEELCRDLGIDLIVLENKEVNNERNYIYINPNQKGCQYRYKNLSIRNLISIMADISLNHSYILEKDMDMAKYRWIVYSWDVEIINAIRENDRIQVSTHVVGMNKFYAHRNVSIKRDGE
ncbi:MAG: thioesterase, partial [Clostridium sp.]|nr:thioesterase [Clostridium sp.]